MSVPGDPTLSQPAGDDATRQLLYLHIGLPKSGSTYLQTALGTNRFALQDAGFLYPYVRQEGMFYAAVEMAGSPTRWGLDPEEIGGTFAHMLRRGRRLGGTVVISHEIFSAASRDQVQALADLVADFEVHVVITVRDLGRTITAGWQEQVKNGDPRSFAEFADGLLSQLPEDPHTAGSFWPAQNLLLVLDRWRQLAPPERTHVVTCPRSGTEPDLLWRRFAEAIGLESDAVELTGISPRNESLGIPQIALLRRVLIALDGRLEQPWFSRIAKRWFAQSLLSQVSSPKPVAPGPVLDRLTTAAGGWVDRVHGEGYRVHGDLAELLPEHHDRVERDPDAATVAEMFEGLPRVLAQMLERNRDLHVQITELTEDRDRLAVRVDQLTDELAERGAWKRRLLSPFASSARE